jgi:hypothetical protein
VGRESLSRESSPSRKSSNSYTSQYLGKVSI